MAELQEQVLSDLKGAAMMMDQAMRRLHPSLALHKEIREVDNTLDSIMLSLEEGDYDL
jgi:hypothetical protein